MAKSRSRKTRKTASTSRPRRKGGAKRKTAKTSRPRTAVPTRRKGLNITELRRDFERAVRALEQRSTRSPEERQVLNSAQERLTLWMAQADEFCSKEMQEICGPTMEIEFLT